MHSQDVWIALFTNLGSSHDLLADRTDHTDIGHYGAYVAMVWTTHTYATD